MPEKASLINYIKTRIDLPDEQLAIIISYFKIKSVKKKQLLDQEGSSVLHMYFVVSGCLRVYFIKPDGAEVTRRFAFENQFSACLVSFISNQPLVESNQALENSELLYINRKDFYHLLAIIPAWEKFYRGYLEDAYVSNTNRLQSFITLDAVERYRLLLRENPVIIQRVSNRLVANYLNISQEALSRLKSKA